MCRQDRPRLGNNEDGIRVIKTMDSVISLGKEMRQRDKQVMIPGHGVWITVWLAVPSTHTGNTGCGPGNRLTPGLGACGRLILSAAGTQGAGGDATQQENAPLLTWQYIIHMQALYLLVLNKC